MGKDTGEGFTGDKNLCTLVEMHSPSPAFP